MIIQKTIMTLARKVGKRPPPPVPHSIVIARGNSAQYYEPRLPATLRP
jgi:hypothetical protein